MEWFLKINIKSPNQKGEADILDIIIKLRTSVYQTISEKENENSSHRLNICNIFKY